MNDERNVQVPEVPTVTEAGFPELTVRGWAGIVAPAGLPREVTHRLSEAVNTALRMPRVQEQFATQGFPGKGSTPEEMARVIHEQLASWGEAVKAAGIAPD
jgi:tripartite-type tricarboxylate transporter receptor subunit TctC